jgi:hypothetical protein
MNKKIALIAAAALVLLAGCSKPQTAWIADFEEAKAASQKTKKDLLIAFTGSDWNDPSKELLASTFTADFFKKASKTYVLCNIDIVQDEKLMDKAKLEKNYSVATKYGVQALPYIALLTHEGDLYGAAATDDSCKTTAGLFTFLDGFKDARKKMVDLKKAIKTSKGVERAKNIDTFLEAVQASQRENYDLMIREVPNLDADGKAGLKGKYLLQIAYLDAIKLYQAGKLVEAGDCFLGLTGDGTSLGAAQLQEAWYMGAYMNAMSGKVDNAKVIEWLEKAIACDPTNPGSKQIQATIEQIKTQPPAGK